MTSSPVRPRRHSTYDRVLADVQWILAFAAVLVLLYGVFVTWHSAEFYGTWPLDSRPVHILRDFTWPPR